MGRKPLLRWKNFCRNRNRFLTVAVQTRVLWSILRRAVAGCLDLLPGLVPEGCRCCGVGHSRYDAMKDITVEPPP
jgi:hypothetical protein